jgi:SpoU rRNA methylase family enzyme
MSTRTIDITPTWLEITPALVRLIEAGGQARQDGIAELQNMARAADKWNVYCKSLQEVKA